MRLLRAVVQAHLGMHLLMLDPLQFRKAPLRGRVAGQLVGSDPLRRLPYMVEEAPNGALAEFLGPGADRLLAHYDAALEKQLLDIAEAEGEAVTGTRRCRVHCP